MYVFWLLNGYFGLVEPGAKNDVYGPAVTFDW